MLTNKLIVLRGAPGAGKTTWLHKHNLYQYTLSPDDIRDSCYNGNKNPEIDSKVWTYILRMAAIKMYNNVPVVIDATGDNPADFVGYVNMANHYGYKVICIDFSDRSLFRCLVQNLCRKPRKWVKPSAVTQVYKRIKKSELPPEVILLKPNQFNERA